MSIPAGLEVTAGYKAKRDTGTFSYAAHAAVVAVDPDTGEVEILDYVVVEDGGMLVNPMIVDGQIWGGTAQGIGTALYEEMRFDAQGQPLASTLSDYLLPGPTEVPDIRIVHMETPSPYTRFGQKGIGEGGAIAPPAAITNAINDALKGLGAELLDLARHAAAHRRGDRSGAQQGAQHEAGRHSTTRGRPRCRRPWRCWRGCRGQGAGRRADAGADAQSAPGAAGAAGRHHAHPRAGRGQRGRRWPRLGATVTHAAIEDGRVPDPTQRLSGARLPRGIAYRAVRTRGTIGGSLAHADPAADWLTCLTALGAEAGAGAAGRPAPCGARQASCAAPWRRSWPTTS